MVFTVFFFNQMYSVLSQFMNFHVIVCTMLNLIFNSDINVIIG